MGMKRKFKTYVLARTKSLLKFVVHEIPRTKTSAEACAIKHVRMNSFPVVFVFVLGAGA